MSFLYSAYGLCLSADQPIPGLAPGPAFRAPDVQLNLGRSDPLPPEKLVAERTWYTSPPQNGCQEPALKVWRLGGGAYFRFLYRDGTEYLLCRSGTQVWGTWPDSLTLDYTAPYLLGPVLGFVLRLRGLVSLHASAVCAADRAIALMGPARAGKSTTAAALARLGHPVLSDDIVVLEDQGGAFLVPPAYPRLCLWPESAKSLYGSADALPLITRDWEKRYLDLTGNGYRFQDRPLPLAAIYLLGGRSSDAAAPFVEDLPPHTGLMTLVANSYVNYLLDKTMRAREFELLAQVANRVPLRRVNPHRDPTRLSTLCDVILEDFQTLKTAAAAWPKEHRNQGV